MLAQLSRWLHRASRGWVTLAAAILFLVFTPLVLPDQAARFEAVAGSGPSPDQSLFYTPADLYRMAESFGAAGRAAYVRARWTFDVVWPLVYTGALATAISWLARKAFTRGSRGRLLNLVPVAGMALDFGENICTSLVIGRYPAATPVVDVLATVFTPLKWLFVGGSFVVLVGVAVIALARALRRNKEPA